MIRPAFITSVLVLAGTATMAVAAETPPPIAHAGVLLHTVDLRRGDTSNWIVEQQPGGTVTFEDDKLVIADDSGCTVWFRQRLTAPVIIVCEVAASSRARVSDLNFFWMANDPARPDDLFAKGHGRTGRFATYDALRTYYVGYGGNANTTTRFRRYDGTGERPLRPEHDLSAPEFLLEPDHVYRIELIATAAGRVQFVRDGEVVFDFTDPEPLTAGWFGFRTVQSRIEVHSFAVFEAVPLDRR